MHRIVIVQNKFVGIEVFIYLYSTKIKRMSRVALRTLTFKSLLKFGKYRDLTVQQLIDLHQLKGIKYIRWSYYQSSNISYNDEVLNRVGITPELRISKPGKITEEELIEKLRLVNREEKTEQEHFSMMRRRRAENKHLRIRTVRITNLVSCRNFLTLRNQGKKK